MHITVHNRLFLLHILLLYYRLFERTVDPIIVSVRVNVWLVNMTAVSTFSWITYIIWHAKTTFYVGCGMLMIGMLMLS